MSRHGGYGCQSSRCYTMVILCFDTNFYGSIIKDKLAAQATLLKMRPTKKREG